MNSLNRHSWHDCMIRVTLTSCLLVSAAIAADESALSQTETADQTSATPGCATLLRHALRPLMGPEAAPLCEQHAGKVLLVVNTASKCGFTPQFESLQTLHDRYAPQGFEVLGFPSEDFRQELDSDAAVAQFCELNYGVSFPMYQKVHVRAADAHPFYQDLAAATGTFPQWNFNKYLIDRNGKVLSHYGSSVLPTGERMIHDIEALLQAPE